MASIIGVETLQHTNGTTAATIDSSGVINQPAKPIMSGRMGTQVSMGGSQAIKFTEFFVDQGGITYNASTGAFTVPKDGVYRICLNGFTSASAGTRIGIYVNGTATSDRYGHAYGGDSSHEMAPLNSVLELNANDYFYYWVVVGSVHNASGDRFNEFSIELIA